MSAATDAVRETMASLRTVARNPGLRRVNLALAGSMIGDWAYATAVIVWAYSIGGAALVGAWTVLRLALMTVATPFGSALADRYSRTRIMVTCDLTRMVLVLGAAGAVQAKWTAVVFVLVTLASLVSTPFRPSQMSLMPSLAERPEELTAANGVSSTLESLAFFVGPALAGGMLAVTGVPAVMVLDAFTFLWSAALVSRIVVSHQPEQPARDRSGEPTVAEGPGADVLEEPTGVWARSVAGFGVIWRDRSLRLITLLYCAQTIVAGASAVFVVAISQDLIGLGAQGVGFLNSAFGVGALAGGLVAVSRAGKNRLARDFGIGVIFWALPLVAIFAWPNVASALLAVVVMGGANPVVDVNASTILQRITPDRVMGRVFGALDTGLIGTMALGALIMPILIHLVGTRWSLGVLAISISVLVLPGLRGLVALDDRLRPPEALAALRGVSLFAALPLQLLESVARQTTRREVAAGDVVIAEGAVGDEFFVIDSGEVEVSQQGRYLRREGTGDFFGEIALLRDVPRTAMVVATEPTTLLVISREVFLDAVTGNRESQTAAEEIVTRRLLA